MAEKLALDRLTFTRFIAAITVVFFHFTAGIPPFDNKQVASLLRNGPLAVSYFFVLSGFVMFSVYGSQCDKGFDTMKYWIARFARIYPVYLLGVLGILLIGNHSLGDIFLQLTLMQSWSPAHALKVNDPAWSLSTEAFFYLIFPFLGRVPVSIGLPATTVLAGFFWLLTQITHGSLLEAFGPDKVHDLAAYFPLLRLSEFTTGMVMAAWLAKINTKWIGRTTFDIFAVVTVTLIGLVLLNRDSALSWLPPYMQVEAGLMAPLFVMLIAFIVLGSGRLTGWMSWKPLQILGESSYALYILQLPLIVWMKNRVFNTLELSNETQFWLYLAVLIVLSISIFFLIEKPARQFLRRLGSAKSSSLRSIQGGVKSAANPLN